MMHEQDWEMPQVLPSVLRSSRSTSVSTAATPTG